MPPRSFSRMASWETVCAIARCLPGAELDTGTEENAAWRVNGRVIARRNPRLDTPQVDEVIAIRTTVHERAALLHEDPHTFFVTNHWATSRNTSVLVRLTTVGDEQLRELITDAWRVRAKKSQVDGFTA
jgi:hypothetical protein